MTILLGIDESKGCGGTLPEQDTHACLLGQGTGKGVAVGEAPEALLEQLEQLIDVEGFPFFSQYLDREVNKRLTSFPLSACQDRFDFRLSLELPNRPQLVIKLKLKDLQKDFLDILFVHERILPTGQEMRTTLARYYCTYY
jgi:hypothetical protein